MSATFGEVRDWEGSTFDPSNFRVFSYLPPEDADEAYCVRHEQDMEAYRPLVHRDGGLYRPGEGWAFYSCPHCRREMGPSFAVARFIREGLAFAFNEWDDPDGQIPREAFNYVREGSPEDVREVFTDE